MTATSCIVFVLVGSLAVVVGQEVCSSFCTSVGMVQTNPGKSCNDIYQINKATRGTSGNYWIQTSTGTHEVYCNMELECGGYKGGWMRIADFNISAGDECPTGWNKITTPGTNGIDVCETSDNNPGCYPTTFSVYGAKYAQVCGQARAYQKGTTNGFLHSVDVAKSIDGPYVDGISITIGSPRQHVWTYAVGLTDDGNHGSWNCPCAATAGPAAPEFVLDHYFCESGVVGGFGSSFFHTDDPLWDGEQCVDANNNCCTDPGMPWFYRQFAVAQDSDIEVRLCRDETFDNEATLVELMQLYVQ